MSTIQTSGAQQEANDIEAHVNRIRESGILARSVHLNRLFEFLYACHLRGWIPKEHEIAVEGLGRQDGFDVTQDALVRVYVHKLRRKLDDYYRHAGLSSRLVVPKGEYRLTLESVEHEPVAVFVAVSQRLRPIQALLAVLAASVFLNLLQAFWQPIGANSHESRMRAESIWQPLFVDDRPVVIVVGDYYIYAETDGGDTVKRLVRDFDINSAMALSNYLQLSPAQAEHKFDVGLSYLPTSTAYALNKLSPILNSGDKKATVVLASELKAETLRNAHIVFIGHLSGLGMLSEVVLEASGFHVGSSYDELVDNASGQRYVTSSGIPKEHGGNPNHLAYLSSIPGPTGNRIITIAGFRDAGLKELADIVGTEASCDELASQHAGLSFEALYQVEGFGQATKPAKLLTIRSLNPNPSAS